MTAILRSLLKLIVIVFVISSLLPIKSAMSRPEYARKTGKGCIFCHQQELGGPLKTVGIAYIRNGYQYPIPEYILNKARLYQSSIHRTLRLIIGYIHMLAAFILVGAIFYIHIFIKPSQITGGIPRGERILGLSCLAILTLTGIYLTWLRIDKFEHFFDNLFGLMLFIKIILFICMLLTALTAVTIIHHKMKAEVASESVDIAADQITADNLNHFDGSDGKPAYVAYENKIYDISQSPKWKNGTHFKKHKAGQDLTQAIKGAPHGSEVLERVKLIGQMTESKTAKPAISKTRKRFIVMAYSNMVFILLILLCISIWKWGYTLSGPYRNKQVAAAAQSCITCHRKLNPGLVHDWQNSVHAKVGVDCYKCHMPLENAQDLTLNQHLKHSSQPICVVVSPKTCEACHPKQVAEYANSKHAHTIEIVNKIDKWIQDGMNDRIERTTGCFACHGTMVQVDQGRPQPGTWPNVGVGRKNPDGSLGSCTSCHTRHKFSKAEARKPEACDQCHLGPDHPQIEIYNESKHGTIYHAEGQTWNWEPDDGQWLAGRDFRAPTCSTCHMSAVGSVMAATHDVTQRLSWETQAPLTVHPDQFAPFPAKTDWQTERQKMEQVCMQCHSESWRNEHFANLDQVIAHYNEDYYKPAKAMMDRLYGQRLLSRQSYFDENLEWEFYELWHYEGRRARMGTAMMAPDYAWWHGFYELKHRYVHFMKEAKDLQTNGPSYIYPDFPGKLKANK